jgi:hypothetical protein
MSEFYKQEQKRILEVFQNTQFFQSRNPTPNKHEKS